MTRQSLWPSYVPGENIQKNDVLRKTNDNKYHKNKPKKQKGESVLAVSRFIIKHNRVDKKRASAELGISVRTVEMVIKKIKEKLGSGQALPGLSNAEEEILLKILSQKEELINKDKARWSKIIKIMRGHVVEKRFYDGYRVADIAKLAGLRRKDVRQMIERLTGRSMSDIAREMFREDIVISEIASKLCIAKKDIKKVLPKVIRVVSCSIPVSEIRRISTIKPSSPKSQRKSRKKPASISRTGLAAWCMLHYNEKGLLELPYGCAAPSDLLRKYPEVKEVIGRAEPRETFFHAPTPSMAEGSIRGRKRIGYSLLD